MSPRSSVSLQSCWGASCVCCRLETLTGELAVGMSPAARHLLLDLAAGVLKPGLLLGLLAPGFSLGVRLRSHLAPRKVSIWMPDTFQTPCLTHHRPGSHQATEPVMTGNAGLGRRLHAVASSGIGRVVSGAVEVGVKVSWDGHKVHHCVKVVGLTSLGLATVRQVLRLRLLPRDREIANGLIELGCRATVC